VPKKTNRSAATGPRLSLADFDLLATKLRMASQIPGALFGIIRSGVRPGPGDSSKWYDRAIRAIGGTLVLLAFLLCFVIALMNQLRER